MTNNRTRESLLAEIKGLEARCVALESINSELGSDNYRLRAEIEEAGDPKQAIHEFLDELSRPVGKMTFIVRVAASNLIDAATALDGESLTFHISSERQPFLVLSNENPDAAVMLAPMHGAKPQ